jgi:hypothetical protein
VGKRMIGIVVEALGNVVRNNIIEVELALSWLTGW